MSDCMQLDLLWKPPGVPSAPETPVLNEFKLFTHLPYELRLEIWRLAVPGSYLVDTKHAKRSSKRASAFVINTTKKYPVLLGVCHESREYFLTHYSLYIPAWYGMNMSHPVTRPYFITFSLKSDYESVYINYDDFFQTDYWITRLRLFNLRQRVTFSKIRILEIRSIDFENVLREDQYGFSPPSFQFLNHFTRLSELCIKGNNLLGDGEYLFGGWQDDVRMYQIAIELSAWLVENAESFNNGTPIVLHYLRALVDMEEGDTNSDDGTVVQALSRCACGTQCGFFDK